MDLDCGRSGEVRPAPRARQAQKGLVLAALVFSPVAVIAQGASADLRGQVVSISGTPMPGVRVTARSASLTLDRATVTGHLGEYALAGLPPGEYVITFEREGFVTLKRVTRLTARESAIADAVIAEAENEDDLISVAVDPHAEPHVPPLLRTLDRARLAPLPLSGGVASALALAPGPMQEPSDLLMVLDGVPVRLADRGDGSLLLAPGTPATEEVTLALSGASTDLARLEDGSVGVVTPAGGDRTAGEFRATIGNASPLADTLRQARSPRAPGAGAEGAVGTPLDARRSWLFGAAHVHAEPLESAARLSSRTFPTDASSRFWELKATHAFTSDHRVQAQLAAGARTLDNAPPAGAISVEEASALASRRMSHDVLSASYAGILGRDLQVEARVSTESSRGRALDAADPSGPSIRDRQTGAAAGGAGWCTDCLLDERTSTAWTASVRRSLTIASDAHVLAAGVELEYGRFALPGPGAGGGRDVLASRFAINGDALTPVFIPNGSSWIVVRAEGEPLAHHADAVFVADEWRRGTNLVIQTGVRWDRQRLETAVADRRLVRHGVSPAITATWQPRGRHSWTLDAGFGRYEAGLLDLAAGPMPPAGDWFAYSGAETLSGPPRFSGADAPWAVLESRSAAGLAPTMEGTAGASRWFGTTLHLDVDWLWRRRDPLAGAAGRTARELDATARSFERAAGVDLGLLTRRYTALIVHGRYDFGHQANLSATYTRSHAWGEIADGAGTGIAEWASPGGDLAGDRPHRLDVSGHVSLLENESLGTATFGGLYRWQSGTPYGAVAWIDAAPWLDGGQTAPVVLPYYFTARDAFRAEALDRTDLAFSYRLRVPRTLRSELVVDFHVLNAFNDRAARSPATWIVADTAFSDPARFPAFDPFAGRPEAGVHWAADPRFDPTAADDTFPDAERTLAREYRLSIGVRF